MQRRRSDGTVEYAAVKALHIPMEEHETQTLIAMGYNRDYIREKYHQDAVDLQKEYLFMNALKDNRNVVHCDDLRVVPSADDGLGCCLLIKMELLTPMEKVMRPFYDEQQVISLGMDICSALAACKKHKIIHRDIKPQNILVSDEGTYKLGDFGVSKTLDHTASGTRIGTFAFMAPEVYANQKYNSIADIYSLGIVLYWMMNNRREPFLPQSNMPPSNSEVQRARERRFNGEMLPYPANGSLALQNAVLRACDPDPKKRFDSPEEMYNTLAALQASQDNFSSGSYHYSYSTGRKKKGSQTRQTTPDSSQGGSPGGSNNFSSGSYHYSYGKKNTQTQQTTPGGGTMGNNWGGEGDGSIGPNDGSGSKGGGTMGADEKKPHKNNVYTSLDVKVNLKLKKSEAASGCQKSVTIRGGRTVKVTVPAGSDKADTLRLPGLGLEDPATGAKGTLYVKLLMENDFWGEDSDPATDEDTIYLCPRDDDRTLAILRTYQPTHQLIKIIIPPHTAQKANPVDVTGAIVNSKGEVVDPSAAPIPLKINTTLVTDPTDIRKMPESMLRDRVVAGMPKKRGFLYYICRIMVWFGALGAVECLFTGLIPQALILGLVAIVGIAGSSSPGESEQKAAADARAEMERRRRLEVH